MQWEYDIHLSNLGDAADFEELQAQAEVIKAELNRRGKLRWELIGIGNGIYIFKRQLLPPERGRLGVV